MKNYDVIIIGGASAGLTAALYTSRQALKTLVLTKDIGGQALLTDSIDNYPGFEHIGGFDLMSKFQEQARSYGAEFLYQEVVEIMEHESGGFATKTVNDEYSASSLILAFGKTPRDLNVPGEQELKGRGVSYCAVCDGPLFRQKKIAIIGAGEPALDAATLLRPLASKVNVVHRTDRFVGNEESINALQSEENVEFIGSSAIKSINGSSKVESITIEDVKSKSQRNLDIDGVFVEMGYIAKTDFVGKVVQLNNSGEIVVDRECATSRRGIFAAGDVTDVPYKQVVTSAGQGMIAALSAYNYVQKLRGKSAVKTDWKSVVKKKE